MERILQLRATCRGFERHIRRSCKRFKRSKDQYLEDNPHVCQAYRKCLAKLNFAKRDWAYDLLQQESLDIQAKTASLLLEEEKASFSRISDLEDQLRRREEVLSLREAKLLEEIKIREDALRQEYLAERERTIEDSRKLKASMKSRLEKLQISLDAEAKRSSELYSENLRLSEQAAKVPVLRERLSLRNATISSLEQELVEAQKIISESKASFDSELKDTTEYYEAALQQHTSAMEHHISSLELDLKKAIDAKQRMASKASRTLLLQELDSVLDGLTVRIEAHMRFVLGKTRERPQYFDFLDSLIKRIQYTRNTVETSFAGSD